jgi:hypothetical protein
MHQAAAMLLLLLCKSTDASGRCYAAFVAVLPAKSCEAANILLLHTCECVMLVTPSTSLHSCVFNCSVRELKRDICCRQCSSSVSGPGSSPAAGALDRSSKLSTCTHTQQCTAEPQ